MKLQTEKVEGLERIELPITGWTHTVPIWHYQGCYYTTKLEALEDQRNQLRKTLEYLKGDISYYKRNCEAKQGKKALVVYREDQLRRIQKEIEAEGGSHADTAPES